MEFDWFTNCRYGLFIHYGLFSLLERGEWVWNREQIPVEEYRTLADRFTAESFDADAICRLAVASGMRYVVMTTMHHEGFRLYPTELSSFHIGKSGARGRDLVAEMVDACRDHGLRVGLYHSLNNWYDQPDAVAAIEDSSERTRFLNATFERLHELVSRYNPIDVLWYDGWWPFDAEGWKAREMNAMVRKIQPHILFNGRNGLPGDFATPEGHLAPPTPWRPWEACMTLNNSWGFHAGDHEWKSPTQVVDLLATCAQRRGNLLLNVGPAGDGTIPEASIRILEQTGRWLTANNDAIFGTDLFTFDLRERGQHRGDWNSHGPLTVRGNSMYLFLRRWPGTTAVLGGLEMDVRKVHWLATGNELSFSQSGSRLVIHGLPDSPPCPICPVLQIECDRAPGVYQCGGLRIPSVPHPHYDPCPSDIAH